MSWHSFGGYIVGRGRTCIVVAIGPADGYRNARNNVTVQIQQRKHRGPHVD